MKISVRRLAVTVLCSYLFANSVCADTAAVAVPVATAPTNSVTSTAMLPVTLPSQPSQTSISTLSAAAPAQPAATGSSAPAVKTGDIPLSTIEKALNSDTVKTQKAEPQDFQQGPLQQFGYNFFRPGTDSFAAQTDIPVGPDYTVGPGDSIILSVWGSLEGTYSLEVNRSGEIQLPRVGPLKVWGASFEHLPTMIRNSMAKVFRDFDINVTMGKLRVIKVYVVGEVHNPGDYNVSSLSTVLNALSVAGGPHKGGSLRNITIRRNGKVVDTVDLYDFFLKGDKSRDIRLQSGDTVFVPIIGPTVGVSGSVKRPAIYELKGENNLKDLLELSGGLLPTGYLQRVQISRVSAHDRITVNDFNLDPKGGDHGPEALAGSIPVRDLDVVRIFPISGLLRDHVRLEGYVLRPGDYAFKPGMRISNLLLPDNVLHEYYRDAGEITRLVAPDFHPEMIIFNPAKAITGDTSYDLSLQEFDTVHMFSRWEMQEMPKVRISGEVQKPGEYRLLDKMTVRDLLIMAGNPKLTAYMKNAEINRIRKTGDSVTSYPITIDLEKALAGDMESNIFLAPFDDLTIRKIPNWSEETDRYVALSGEFVFPGVYPIHKGERLSSVITRAGGFTGKAYLKGAKFTRETIRKLQQQRMDEALERAQEEILNKKSTAFSAAASKEEMDATKASLDALERSLAILKTKKAEGRMIISLTSAEKLVGSRSNIELNGGDVLYVPSDPNSINVLGYVYNPTSEIFEPRQDIRYYLDKVGGPTSEGETDDIYLVKADGTVYSQNQAGSFLFYNSFFSTSVDSGDTIVVPQKLEKSAWLRDIKDITTIVSQIALSAGVIFLGLR